MFIVNSKIIFIKFNKVLFKFKKLECKNKSTKDSKIPKIKVVIIYVNKLENMNS